MPPSQTSHPAHREVTQIRTFDLEMDGGGDNGGSGGFYSGFSERDVRTGLNTLHTTIDGEVTTVFRETGNCSEDGFLGNSPGADGSGCVNH